MPFTAPLGTVYFGYGSNLWKDQMRKRCSNSIYLGVARLNGYQWIINDRGYANVVEDNKKENADSSEVWGLVYALSQKDEDRLDVNEGVPIAYTKEDLMVDFWPVQKDGEPPSVKEPPETLEMLVYIDRKRTQPDVPKKEYVYRMNMGIKDALKEGMPKQYLDRVLRNFIPDTEDQSVEKFAKQQAISFEDED